jgi:integrase/recombinase XerD
MKSLEKVFKEYLLHCQFEKNLSIKTLRAYSSDIEQFIGYLNKTKVPLDNICYIDKAILRSYLQNISAFKPKTVKRKVASLKALFNFLEYEDIIQINPLRKMRVNFKEPFMLPKSMNINEVKQILDVLYSEESMLSGEISSYKYVALIRDIAIVELLFATGVRVSELCNLKVSNIDLSNGRIIVYGKGSKERIIQVCNKESLSIIRKYYNLFEKQITESGYFFINRLRKPISEQSVRFMVKKYSKQAGIDKIITPHTFRHTFATLLLEENVDIKYIQHLLGHSSIMTTQIYTQVNRKKQEQILSQFHPRNSIHMVGVNA